MLNDFISACLQIVSTLVVFEYKEEYEMQADVYAHKIEKIHVHNNLKFKI